MNSLVTFSSQPRLYHCEENWNWCDSGLDDYDFWLVLDGKGRLILNGTVHPVSGGSAFVLRPGDRIEADHDPQAPLRVFAFHFTATAPPLPPAAELPLQRRLTDVALLEAWVAKAEWPLLPREPQRRTAGLACAALLSLYAESPQPPASDRERLEICAQSIRRQPGQQTRIPEFARRCGMSEGHFSRRFKRMFGVSPTRFRLKARIERASHLLQHSGLTLTDIADAVGFHDEMHLSKVFRREKGMPPGAYRISFSRHSDETTDRPD